MNPTTILQAWHLLVGLTRGGAESLLADEFEDNALTEDDPNEAAGPAPADDDATVPSDATPDASNDPKTSQGEGAARVGRWRGGGFTDR